MHRAQVLLEKWQYELLKSRAEQQHRSISEILREMLTRELNGKPVRRKKGDIEEILGIITKPHTPARDIDKVVYGRGKR